MSEICVEAFNLVAQIGVLSLKTERERLDNDSTVHKGDQYLC